MHQNVPSRFRRSLLSFFLARTSLHPPPPSPAAPTGTTCLRSLAASQSSRRVVLRNFSWGLGKWWSPFLPFFVVHFIRRCSSPRPINKTKDKAAKRHTHSFYPSSSMYRRLFRHVLAPVSFLPCPFVCLWRLIPLLLPRRSPRASSLFSSTHRRSAKTVQHARPHYTPISPPNSSAKPLIDTSTFKKQDVRVARGSGLDNSGCLRP